MIIIYPFVITTVLILSLVYLIYLYYQRSFEYWSSRNVPHPKPSFPFGNFNRRIMRESGRNVQHIYNELRKSGAKYGGIYMFTMPFFMPVTPEMYKEVLIKSFQCFQGRGLHYDEENDPMSANLAALTGSKWKYIRSKVNPAFSIRQLKLIFPTMLECSTGLLDILNISDKINIHSLATGYSMEIICYCGLGIDGNNIKDPNTKFRQFGRKVFTEMSLSDSLRIALGLMASHILKMFKISLFNPKYTKFFHKLTKDAVEYRENNNVKRNDLLDLLIRLKHNENIEGDDTDDVRLDEEQNKCEKGLTLTQIAAQIFAIFIAGYETTTMALTFCMYELARHPNIQLKVREEILKVIQENDGEITFDAINNMNYTDQVIQETLRMYPPVLMLNRIVTQRYHVPDSTLTLEEGTRVIISTLGVHYDPEFYPQPNRFDPGRFSAEEKSKRPSMTYLPFGDGPRSCIGQKFATIEIKIALAVFLKNFKYTVHPSTKSNIETFSNTNLIYLKDKIWLKSTKI